MPSSRHRTRLWLAGAAVTGVAALLLLRRPDEPPPAPAPAVAAPVPVFTPPPMPAQPPVPQRVAANTAGLQLKGVLGFSGARGAAIFELPGGRQRSVAVGGEVMPGVRLEAIGADRAMVHDGVQRLEFVLPELRSEGGPAAAAMPAPLPPPPPAIDMRGADRDPAELRRALKAEGGAGRPQGYRLTGAAPLPALEGAGLRPGDLILAVNGQALDEARLRELPAAMAAASSVTIDFERDGERMSTTLGKD